MTRVVIGTAGHIDHGKTTLVKALTGIETDVTKEELKRGMSINLGFAYLNLANGRQVGIVDVPGHEKFIKNMLAGVAGINLVMLVIDVNEGVMPQTQEHIDILSLLGVKDFIVVLTKCDSVEPDYADLVLEDLKEQFKGTALEKSVIVKTDAVSGFGLSELKEEIKNKVEDLTDSEKNTLDPRLNIDRVFSVNGFGTVVTGTLLEGSLSVGDDVVIYPQGIKTKIRNIQVHEKNQQQAFPGQRTAINLTKVTSDKLSRGNTLTVLNNVESSWMLDIKVTCLDFLENKLSLWDRVHFHVGTQEVLARVVPLGAEEIGPGEEGFLQLRLEEQVVVKKGDHFIIRSYSPVRTIAGGTILETLPSKHRRYKEGLLQSLMIKEKGDISDLIIIYLQQQPELIQTIKSIADHINSSPSEVSLGIEDLIRKNRLIKIGRGVMLFERLHEIEEKIISNLTNFHHSNPYKLGMDKASFHSVFPGLKLKELELIYHDLETRELISQTDKILALKTHRVAIPDGLKVAMKEVEQLLLVDQFQPYTLEELTAKNLEALNVIGLLGNDVIVYLTHDIILHKKNYRRAMNNVTAFLQANEQISLAECRDLLKSSRKYSLLFLEHLDDLKITYRDGDYRRLVAPQHKEVGEI
ncbi:selenocysteine-specific translation elongation factor [Vagococcus coleopterorum]|uniref:Selenocysteine-specific elongation factor n=1 Tax=Vagococcus coleopterorum TaxID=2714946 RepID=A0A6G8ANP5_9ENTE|nr:selenocysteine-specific translation elongation factor [Vagococcus coleopterorum]QIL46698.1 selenocysteine-specific translation elongation factor [Vagococcus coleopterorum]